MQAELPALILAVLIITAGTAVQAAIGFGLAMIAAPLLLLIFPPYVPGPVIVVALVLSLWVAWRERHAIDVSKLKAALAGRLVGTPLAALLLGSMSAATFDLVFGVLVLSAVAMSLVHTTLKPTSLTVFLAMVVSGFMGTLSSIGGPPVALVYQNARAAELRANLAALFVIGTVVSLLALAVVGRFGPQDFAYSLVLLTGVVPGIWCSRPVKRFVDRRSARPWLLGLCALSALAVLVRAGFNLTAQ